MNYNRPSKKLDTFNGILITFGIVTILVCAILITWKVLRATNIYEESANKRINGYYITIPKNLQYDGNYYCHKYKDSVIIEPLTYSEYQVSYGNKDSLVVYDGERFVGKIPYSHSLIDSLLSKDNEWISTYMQIIRNLALVGFMIPIKCMTVYICGQDTVNMEIAIGTNIIYRVRKRGWLGRESIIKLIALLFSFVTPSPFNPH